MKGEFPKTFDFANVQPWEGKIRNLRSALTGNLGIRRKILTITRKFAFLYMKICQNCRGGLALLEMKIFPALDATKRHNKR